MKKYFAFWGHQYYFPRLYFILNLITRILVIVKRVITLERANKQRTDNKNEEKRININKFTRSKREKPNIAIAIWRKKNNSTPLLLFRILCYQYYFRRL